MRLNALLILIAELDLTADEVEILLGFVRNLKTQHDYIASVNDVRRRREAQEKKIRRKTKE